MAVIQIFGELLTVLTIVIVLDGVMLMASFFDHLKKNKKK
jgi:hypothetical protein